MGKEADEKKHRSNNRGGPNYAVSPSSVDCPEVRAQRECNQCGDDKPAIVQAQFYAKHAGKFDLRFHFYTLLFRWRKRGGWF